MKEEVKRIMKLVQEGKLSPEDAAELIEAFNDAPEEPVSVGSQVKDQGAKGEDPFSRLVGSIEKIGKDVAKNVNWEDIASQVRQGVSKGIEAIKHAADEAKKGGGFSVFFGSAQTKRTELPLEVSEGKPLRIEGRSGDVTILGGAETGLLVVDATFRAYDEEEAKRLAEAYTPVIEEGDQGVVFRQPDSPNLSADVTAHVPAGVPVEVKLASGDVKVVDTKANVKIDGASGDVKVLRAGGAVNVAVRSGDVRIEETEANLIAVETKSGNIALSDVSGVLEVKTSSGDVTIAESRAKTVSVEAASGDVSVDLATPVQGTVNLTAVSGDVSLSVMDGSDCRVNLSTLRGTVTCSVPLEDEVIEAQKVTGRMGSGNNPVDVSVVTGTVRMFLRDSAQS